MAEGVAHKIRLGLVGIGKIARDQHLPALAGDGRYELVATSSRNASVDGVTAYKTIEELIAGEPGLTAVSLCTPPEGRYEQAIAAIDAGLHVMLEKPPAATLAEIAALADRAKARGVVLYTTWHSREAAGVEPAAQWLQGKQVKAVRITWREDIRRWHPGQDWILAAGGFGVFDPGINALSIATLILPDPLLLKAATMDVPAGRASPLAASMTMKCGDAPAEAHFDFLQTGPQTWDIEIDTDAGTLRLGMGGSILQLPGGEEQKQPDREYARLYARFADLVASGTSDVDVRPLQIVADAFLLAERRTTEAFEW